MDKFKQIIVPCSCQSLRHIVRLTKYKNDEYFHNDMTIEVLIEPTYGFFRKLKEAFNYVFGLDQLIVCETILNDNSQKLIKDSLENM